LIVLIMPIVRINDVELHYEKFGNGGAPIVFVHGFLASSKMWQDFYIPNLPASYHAYAIDMRGHGQSHHIKHGCNVFQLADDVFQFSQQLQFEKFIYVGMSMGGATGIQLALDHPEVLKALILMNPGFGSTFSRGSRLMAPLFALIAQKQWFMKMLLKSMLTRPPSENLIQAFLNDGMLVSKETWAEYLHHTNRIQQLERFSHFEVPTLVMIGAKDHVLPLDMQHRLAAVIPNAKKIIFEDEGHGMVEENPKAVFRAMMFFLEQHSL